MRLDIRRVFELEGDPCGVPFEQEISLADIRLGGMTPFPAAVQLRGQVVNRAGIVTLSYQLQGMRHCRCDRCLKEWEEPFCQPFEHTVVRRVNNEADEDEFLDVYRVPLEEAFRRVMNGEFKDAKTQIGIMKIREMIKNGSLS